MQTSDTSVAANVNAVKEERLNVQPQVTLDSIRVADPFSEPGIVTSAGYVNPVQPLIHNAQPADPTSRSVNDAPRSANDAPNFTNGDPKLANGFSRLAYMCPNQLIFGEDVASLCAATVNTSGPSKPIPMSTMLLPAQTHSVNPSVRPQRGNLDAKLKSEGRQMPQIKAPAPLVDVHPPPTCVRSYCTTASGHAASSGYPMGVPPSQNLHAGPSPRVNGKIGGQQLTSTPQPPPVQVEGQPTMERLSCPPSIPESVVFSKGRVAQQIGNSGDKVSKLGDKHVAKGAHRM
ncbi:hypothetical protein AMTR_s00026p00188460 [Amborella trichopoda]|uniref:Uncharacterized protein n=1 Tax=Amborella trichopoda TaxID=13333 RepID=W1PRF7_AMBTC|nr:hypothetical protein AMTR_s00026p00188460 [Amborella trichopoda]